jgi:hypothetical protein
MDPSIGLRNAALAAVKDELDGGFLYLFSGTVPATPDAATGASTLLATLSVDDDGTTGLTFAAPTGGSMAKTSSENWEGTVLANGTVTYARFCASGDDGTGASSTAPRLQLTVGTAGAELNLSSVVLATGGDPVKVGGFSVNAE